MPHSVAYIITYKLQY